MLAEQMKLLQLQENLISLDVNKPDNLFVGATKINDAFVKVESKSYENDKSIVSLDNRILSTQKNLVSTALELNVIKGATLSGVDSNIVLEQLRTADDINLLFGYHDSNLNKIAIK